MQQESIQVGLPPDFPMKLGRVEVFHQIQIKLIYAGEAGEKIIPLADRSLHRVALAVQKIVRANLRGPQKLRDGIRSIDGYVFFADFFPVIHINYCFPDRLNPESKSNLSTYFHKIFD